MENHGEELLIQEDIRAVMEIKFNYEEVDES